MDIRENGVYEGSFDRKLDWKKHYQVEVGGGIVK